MTFSDAFLEGSLVFISVWFALISAASVAKLIWLFRADERAGWNVSKVIHCLVPLTCLAQLVDIMYYYFSGYARFYFLDAYHEQSPGQMLADAFPGYLFISVYVLLCLFWFEVYPVAFTNRVVSLRRLKTTYLMINFVLYTCWATFLIIVFASEQDSSRAHRIEVYFTLSVTFIMGVVFVVSGVKLYNRLSRLPVKSPETLEIGNKVGILAIVFSIGFFVRVPLIYAGFFKEWDDDLNYALHLIFPVVLQGVPAISVLILLGWRKRERTEGAYAKLPISQPLGSTSPRSYGGFL